MRTQSLVRFLDDSLTFPTDLQTVCREVGDVPIEAPAAAETHTIAEVLDLVEQETYFTAQELYESIQSNLHEGYVGRKHYSDREGYLDVDVDGWIDGANRSF